MSYSEFTLEKVQTLLDLTIEDGDLFSSVNEYPLSTDFLNFLRKGSTLALAINTEKAKSEFIIAPVLLETKSLLNDAISIFSGIEFSVDPAKGLNGVCDFIISSSKWQHLLTSPIITIVEAKNDNLRDGLGQCIAEMFAAQQFNRNHHEDRESIHGIVTIGSSWKFIKLNDKIVTLDLQEYFINNPQKIIGILIHILGSSRVIRESAK
jgi:hypothetical protein